MASRKITKAIFLLLFAYQNIPEVKSNECTAIISDDITSCATTSIYRQRKDFLAATCRTFTETRSNTTCDRNSFCRQNFKISHFSQMLFSSTMGDSFLTMLRSCCGACAQCHVEHKKLINISQLTPDTINTSDLIFPVLGHDSMDKIYGYHFIPVYKVPNSYYFRLKETGSKKMIKVIYACGRMWPLLIICVLMALISGFITWAMEIRRNPSEFSKPFHVGVFEGFWWGFVSMTTVGYGDKVPKTIPGRLFAIIWILIGITVCSIFTASLTTEIINARKLPNPDLSGKKVGVMVHRMHDTTLVTQHGGIIHQVNISKTTLGIKTMMDLLLEGKHIDGFVMNMNTYYFFKHRRKELAKIIKDKMEKTGKSHDGKQLYTGILVKTKEQYDYFLKYFQTNRLQLESCHDLRLNLKRTEDEDENISLFSPKGALFISFLYYLCAALGLIACFGIVYEFRRNRQKLQQRFEREDGGILYNSFHYLKLDSCYKGTSFNGSKSKEETENV